MTPINQPLVLIIDDEVAILRTLKESLEDEGFRVEVLSDEKIILETIGKLVPNVVLLDIFMPNFDGLAMLLKIKREYPNQAVIMMSGFGTIQIAIQALQQGAIDFIEKPFTLDLMLKKLAFTRPGPAVELHPNTTLKPAYLIGESTLFNELLSQATILAGTGLPIIIYGPPGCGKQSLAQYMHDIGPNPHLPFITTTGQELISINPALLSQPATLFVKHIDLADQLNQVYAAKLLTDYPHIRVIASSAPSLFARMQKGLFDSTLFCKLNVVPIEIPALTKRRYDIPLLVSHFLNESNQKFNTNISISTEGVRLLRNYHWQGDVAQLKNFVSILSAQSSSKNTMPIVIDPVALKKILPEDASLFVEPQSYARFSSLDDATATFQREYIQYLLKKYRYDTNQLAEFLSISVDSLHSAMHKLHLTLH